MPADPPILWNSAGGMNSARQTEPSTSDLVAQREKLHISICAGLDLQFMLSF